MPKRLLLYLIAVVSLGVVGYCNFLTGEKLSFTLFYLAPILLIAWYLQRVPAYIFSLFAASLWYWIDSLTGPKDTWNWIGPANAAVRFVFFIGASYLTCKLKQTMEYAQELSSIDSLTGIPNSRTFRNVAERESARARRHTLSIGLIYIDLDNFKTINDLHGHHTGDELLSLVASILQANLRPHDLVARLGGDEFGLLLPETNEAAARTVAKKLDQLLVQAMAERAWPVSFSIGVVSFLEVIPTVDEMLRQADKAMYCRKFKNKAGVLAKK